MLRVLGGDGGLARLNRLILLGLAYFAAAELGLALSPNTYGQPFATFWPAAGLLVAVLGRLPGHVWPETLLVACTADVAFNLLHGNPAAVSVGFSLAHCLEASVGAWLLRHCFAVLLTLERVKEVLGLAFLAAFGSTLLGATLGATVVALAYEAPFGPAWSMWWIADAVGVLVVAPVLLTWDSGSSTRWQTPGVVEAVVLFGGMILIAHAIYGEWLPPPLGAPIFVLPFLLWAGFRLGPFGSAAALLAVGLVGIWNTSQGRGPYSGTTMTASEQLLRAQATLCAISMCVLVLAATITERKAAEEQRIKLIGELEQALGEIQTLRGLIPLCAWCKNIRDDQGFWQRLEDYLGRHTGAEFTHGLCPACLEKQLVAANPNDAGEQDHTPTG